MTMALWLLLALAPAQESSKDSTRQIEQLLARKFDWGAEQTDLTLYLHTIVGFYCDALEFYIDPVAVPDPAGTYFTLEASPRISIGEALTRDLKPKGLRLVIWEGIVVITNEKGKAAFEKPDWSGLSEKVLEGRRDLSQKLGATCDFKICPFDPRKALEQLSRISDVSIDAEQIGEEAASGKRGRLLYPAKAKLRAALICLSRATGITFQVTDKGLLAVPPQKAER
jgi:hypothetical protein